MASTLEHMQGGILLYSQFSVIGLPFRNVFGKDFYIASFPGDRQLYSKLSVIGLLFNNCLGERLLYSQLSGG